MEDEISRDDKPGARDVTQQTDTTEVSNIPGWWNANEKNKKLFSSEKCNKIKVRYNFNDLFEKEKNIYTVKKILSSDDNTKTLYELEKLTLHYFIGFHPEMRYMIIASRLDNYDTSYDNGEKIPTPEDNDREVEDQFYRGGAGGAGDAERVTEFMEKLRLDSSDPNPPLARNKVQYIDPDKLSKYFIAAVKKNLATNSMGKPYYSYTKYNLDDISQEIKDEYKDLGEMRDGGVFNHYYFKATFKGVYIPNDTTKKDNYFYFEKTIVKSNIAPVKGKDNDYTEPIMPVDTDLANSELTDRSGSGTTVPAAMGGYSRKLKRKELNTMTLNELKQLHRNNGIKMNSNKTVNALIDNYIKNYE